MNRRNLWIGAAVLGAGLIFWAVGQSVGPSSGDQEFQKSLDAMMQVKTFRGTFSASGYPSERLWEVDCNRVIVHQQSGGGSDSDMKQEEVSVGDQRYVRDSNGSWENIGQEPGDRGSAKWYCGKVASGTADLLPDMRTILSHGIPEKGDRKTVNGVRCRDWKFDMRTAISSRIGSVCIGIDDHLPYEWNMDGGVYSYSDFNRPIQIDTPSGTVQPASSTESN